MSRNKSSVTNFTSRLSESTYSSPKLKDLTWDASVTDTFQNRRNGSFSAADSDRDPARPDDEKSPKTTTQNMSIEERLLLLERDMSQLVSSSGAARALSEYGQEQISELDFVHYRARNEIVRVSSDDWHEKKGGKFAIPETSVLTVSTTSRHWAGRHAVAAPGPVDTPVIKESILDSDTPLTEVTAERPYRLSITGYELHRELEKEFGLPISLTNNVWIWPFKHFVTWEPRIRQRLITLRVSITEMEQRRLQSDGPIGQGETAGALTGLARPSTLAPEDENISEENEEAEKYNAALRLEGQLKCLVEFMDTDMKEIFFMKQRIETGTQRSIAFHYMWLLFKPGDLIFTSSTQKRAYVVLHVTGGRAILDIGDQPSTNARNAAQPTQSWEQHEDQGITYAHSKNTPFIIDTFYIDFDGENFGPVPRKFVIQEYEGDQEIIALPAFPATFDKDMQKTKEMLRVRGEKFVKLAGVAHKKYAGLSAREPSVVDWQEEVNSDVVIDFAEAVKKFSKEIPNWVVGLGAGVVDQASRADRRETNEIKPCATKGCTLCKQSDIFDDSYHDLERRSEFLDKTALLRYRAYGKENLDEEQIILLPPRVYGYSLLDRFWYPLNIDRVENIKSSAHNGFDDLVLPGDHKRIMQALVKHHTRGSRPTSGKSKAASEYSADLVRGKGRGLIILLHGVPGVGKTSTAECVAAQTKRPLFPITCGDIGTTASEVEQRLDHYFDLAHKWGCVLLLDEADVYLATREKGGDLQRNSLVSVFLRVLEYYSGILILTTNRVGEFDEAFKSRIHISLYYPKLDRKSTIKIWEMNLNRLERSKSEDDLDIDVDEDRIMRFAEDHWEHNSKKPSRRWNGRQIKNAFQTAIALATWDFNVEKEGAKLQRPRLTDKHFKIVSQTSAHFDDYLSQVHQIDDEETFGVMAAREGLRADDARQIRWSEPRDSSTVKARSNRRAIRGAAKDESDVSEYDEEEERSDSLEEWVRDGEQNKARRRRRKSSTKEYDDDQRRKEKPSRRNKTRLDDSEAGEESEERPRRQNKAKTEKSSDRSDD